MIDRHNPSLPFCPLQGAVLFLLARQKKMDGAGQHPSIPAKKLPVAGFCRRVQVVLKEDNGLQRRGKQGESRLPAAQTMTAGKRCGIVWRSPQRAQSASQSARPDRMEGYHRLLRRW
jgi:hypothetical protein